MPWALVGILLRIYACIVCSEALIHPDDSNVLHMVSMHAPIVCVKVQSVFYALGRDDFLLSCIAGALRGVSPF